MSRERNRFLAGVAHDLRQPLTVVDLAARLLVRHPLEPQSRELVERILEGTQRLGDLTGELLEVGDPLHLARDRVELAALVGGVARSLLATYPERTLSLEIPPNLFGHWDRPRILRIVQNLLENAFLHSDPRDQVSVSASSEGGRVTLRIENFCREPDKLSGLFQPSRGGDRRGRAGLDLYIARELARAHGGEVSVSVQDGVIALVLRLPIAESDRRDVFERPRRHPRVLLHNRLEVVAGGQTFWVRGRDLSQRGLGFFSDVRLAVDERIRLVAYSAASSFSVSGTVRHVQDKPSDALVGVEFPVELSAAELELLKQQRAPA